MRRFLLGVAAVGAVGALAANTHAAVLYSVTGDEYQQDFNSLPNTPTNASLGASPLGWTDDNAAPAAGNFSLVGWYLDHRTTQAEGGFNGKQRFRHGSGSSGTGAFYGFGVNASTDRAMGILPASTLTPNGDSMRIGLRLTNTTGQTLTSFTITYDGEQWRDSAGTNSLSFSYGIGLTPATWHSSPSGAVPGSVTFVPAAAFNAPVTTNPVGGATVDGNGVGKVADITATVNLAVGNEWLPGSDLWLRWSEIQVGSIDDDGLGIDRVRFSAVPEPAGLTLLALGAGTLLRRRRQPS